jgi:hypothetical protein
VALFLISEECRIRDDSLAIKTSFDCSLDKRRSNFRRSEMTQIHDLIIGKNEIVGENYGINQ